MADPKAKKSGAMETLKLVRLGIAGAIVGAALANIFAKYFGLNGIDHAAGAVAGGLLTATILKLGHVV